MLTGGPPFQFGDNSQLLFDTITETPLPPVADRARRSGGGGRRGAALPREEPAAAAAAARDYACAEQRFAAARIPPRSMTRAAARTPTARSSGEVSWPALDAIQDVARWQRRVGAAVAGVALTMLWFTLRGARHVGQITTSRSGARAHLPMNRRCCGRSGGCARCSPRLGWSVILAVGLLAATSVLRASSMAIPPYRRIYQGAVERAGRVGAPGSCPVVRERRFEFLLVAQVAVVGGILCVHFREAMNGLDSFVTADYAALEALSPAHGDLHGLLREGHCHRSVVCRAGWIVLGRAALAASDRTPRGHVWAGAMPLTIGSLVLFQAFPFRILYPQRGERVSYQSNAAIAPASAAMTSCCSVRIGRRPGRKSSSRMTRPSTSKARWRASFPGSIDRSRRQTGNSSQSKGDLNEARVHRRDTGVGGAAATVQDGAGGGVVGLDAGVERPGPSKFDGKVNPLFVHVCAPQKDLSAHRALRCFF